MPSLTTALVKADGVITVTADADIASGETTEVGGKIYTFETTPTDDGDVKYVAGFAANFIALAKAINLNGIAATDYDIDMTKNKDVSAVVTSAGVLTITARVGGTVGNHIPLVSGTSEVVVSGVTGGKLDGGLGDISEAIDDLQARGQLNSDLIEFLALLEVGPKAS